jgi:hypothetical protein
MLPAALALMAGTAQATTRSYIVTDFDTVRLEAPIAVTVTTNRGVTARGEGDMAVLEETELTVSGNVLTIRVKKSPFETRHGANAGVAQLFLTVPALRRIQLSGAGSITVQGMRAQHPEIFSAGSGALNVTGLDGDVLAVSQMGSGAMQFEGKAAKAVVQLSGSGSIDATKLVTADLEVTAQGSGLVQSQATRSAKVTALGAASVTVDGHPACTVNQTGSGRVVCVGKEN